MSTGRGLELHLIGSLNPGAVFSGCLPAAWGCGPSLRYSSGLYVVTLSTVPVEGSTPSDPHTGFMPDALPYPGLGLTLHPGARVWVFGIRQGRSAWLARNLPLSQLEI